MTICDVTIQGVQHVSRAWPEDNEDIQLSRSLQRLHGIIFFRGRARHRSLRLWKGYTQGQHFKVRLKSGNQKSQVASTPQ